MQTAVMSNMDKDRRLQSLWRMQQALMLSSHCLDQAPPEMQEQQKMLLNMQQQFEANAALTAPLRIGQQMPVQSTLMSKMGMEPCSQLDGVPREDSYA